MHVLPGFASLVSAAFGGDWPTYRAGSARWGYTAEPLAENLSRVWVYEAGQKPAPAWPDVHWQKMAFDSAYQPVVADVRLYFGSSADGAVHATDARRGQPQWQFATAGPIRFAPVVWKPRVLAVNRKLETQYRDGELTMTLSPPQGEPILSGAIVQRHSEGS
jgi:hypothetical protein